MIAITTTRELHSQIQKLIAEPDESLRRNLRPIDSLSESVQKYYEGRGTQFDVRHIWSDALNIPDHLQVIANVELNRRGFGGEPLKFINY